MRPFERPTLSEVCSTRNIYSKGFESEQSTQLVSQLLNTFSFRPRNNANMKTIGLLGGMSWESSSLYYSHMNRAVRSRLGGTHSCKSIMYSFDFAEIEKLQETDAWAALTDTLAEAAIGLRKAGAEGLLLCTNTMHKVAPEIESKAGLPVLHIADFTGQKIVEAGFEKVGLLATRYTMEHAFYKDRLVEKFGLEVLTPSASERTIVHDIIYEELVRGIIREESKKEYIKIIDSLVARGAKCIILGCTEITLLIGEKDSPVPVFDTTALHCEGAIDWTLEPSDNLAANNAVDKHKPSN